MKLNIVTKLLAIGLLMVVGTSCDQLKSLIKLNIDTQYDIDVPISLNAAGSEIGSDTISLADDKEVEENLEYLTDIAINSIKLSITSYSGTAAIYDVDLSSDDTSVVSLKDVNIPELFESKEVIVIKDAAALKDISKKLLKNKQVKLDFKAINKSGAPVTADFNIHCVIDAKVSASPIK